MRLNPPPKASYTENWAKQDLGHPKRRTDKEPVRVSEIIRRQNGKPQDHWVVQEAERRRLAQKNERERLQKLQSRHCTPFVYNQSYINETKGKFEASMRKDVPEKIPYSSAPVKDSQSELPVRAPFNGHVSPTSPTRDHNQTVNFVPMKLNREEDKNLSLSGREKCANCGQELGMLLTLYI